MRTDGITAGEGKNCIKVHWGVNRGEALEALRSRNKAIFRKNIGAIEWDYKGGLREQLMGRLIAARKSGGRNDHCGGHMFAKD